MVLYNLPCLLSPSLLSATARSVHSELISSCSQIESVNAAAVVFAEAASDSRMVVLEVEPVQKAENAAIIRYCSLDICICLENLDVAKLDLKDMA